ncbi:MAG: transposase [Candidatus Dadabacteria bacterium]|nr:transposase [Candidatus Dadabacteria bacterium]NIV16797.1 transposase [Fodinibius sp.]
MTLSYRILAKKPFIFSRLTGVTHNEFNSIVQQVSPLWEEAVESKKQCTGRRSPLATLEDKLVVLLMYYRTYMTHEFLGYLFNLHNSNISRLFKRLEPLVARRISIKKDRSLTQEAVTKLLADVTEQPIQRPKRKKKRKQTYSGKKKRHTRKVELVMQDTGKIIALSHSHPGRVHDFKLRTGSTPLPPKPDKYVDLGYQGLQKRTTHVKLPFKRSKQQALTAEQKAYNRQHASFRIKIEHKIRELKVFKILADVYRNFQKKHHLRFNIIAGIVNLKHGF